MASSALTCNSSRVFTPIEADKIRDVIEKPSSKALFNLMLYTGLRLAEVQQADKQPRDIRPGSQDHHDQERQSEGLPDIPECMSVR